MLTSMIRMTATVVALLLMPLTSACGDETPGGERAATAPYSLPVHAADIPLDQVSWAEGSTLHVGDREIELGHRIDQYALTPHAIVFMDRTTLWSSDGTSAPVRVAETGLAHLVLSSDRRYLGFIDREHGPRRDGESIAELVVFDTATGKQLIRDSRHIGETDDGVGQAELFEQGILGLAGFDEDSAYAGQDDLMRFPLDGGDPERAHETGGGSTIYGTDVGIVERDGRWVTAPPGNAPPAIKSPEGDLAVAGTLDRDRIIAVDLKSGQRRPIRLAARRFLLAGWQGPTRFYGFVDTGSEYLGTGRMVSCDATSGACTNLTETYTVDYDSPLVFEASSTAFF